MKILEFGNEADSITSYQSELLSTVCTLKKTLSITHHENTHYLKKNCVTRMSKKMFGIVGAISGKRNSKSFIHLNWSVIF